MAPSSLGNLLVKAEKPLIGLSVFAILVYLGEIFWFFPQEWRSTLLWGNLFIDLIFFTDLLFKIWVRGRSYLSSPWFVVDSASTLPLISSLIEVLGTFGPDIVISRVSRLTRLAALARTSRFLTLARSARLARLLRLSNGMGPLRLFQRDVTQTPLFANSVRWGIPFFLITFMGFSYAFQSLALHKIEDQLLQRVNLAHSESEIRAMPDCLPGSGSQSAISHRIWVTRTLEGHERTFTFSIEKDMRFIDRMKGLVFLFFLTTLFGGMVLIGKFAGDQKSNHELQLLSQCFSPALVRMFLHQPEIFESYVQQWVTVFFIDIHGFTAASEQHGDDIEGLAVKLRAVMDIARREIVEQCDGIVDKFLGDAVMGWKGGHFSRSWQHIAGFHQRLRIDELETLERDLRCLERERKRFKKETFEPHFMETGNESLLLSEEIDFEKSISEIRRRREEILEHQRCEFAAEPELQEAFHRAEIKYQREVAKIAVVCALRIQDAVAAQTEPGAFLDLKIGMASGNVGIGNFGASEQIGYTVLGATVNLAARLEPAAAANGCRFFLDEATYALLHDDPDLMFRPWGKIRAKGINRDLTVYEPFHRDAALTPFLEAYALGKQALENGDSEAAIREFTRADQLRPGGDPASQVHLKRLGSYQEHQTVLS